MRTIRAAPERDLLNKAIKCYSKELVIGVKTNRPDWYKPGPRSITSRLWHISEDEDLFLSKSGAKW